MAGRKRYSTDLSDGQWGVIGEFMPAPKKRGKKREVDLREVINAILYQSRTGCQWGNLPHDFPPNPPCMITSRYSRGMARGR
jgi:putative transposase